MNNSVNILGATYSIELKKYDDDPVFKKREAMGYMSGIAHMIVICDAKTYPGCDDLSEEMYNIANKDTLRHEIVHCFLEESGLSSNSFSVDGPWATNEEMIDWFALQGPKIYKAWIEADAI